MAQTAGPPSPSPTKLFLLCAALVALIAGVWVLRDRTATPPTVTQEAAESGAKVRETKQRPSSAARASAHFDLTNASQAAISGKVSDGRGQAIAGAQVCAFVEPEQLHGAGSSEPRCTRSGSDGYYRIEGLWPVITKVGASAKGYIPERWRGAGEDAELEGALSLAPGQQRSSVDIQLQPGGVALRGVVKDIAGGEVEGARVWSEWSVARSDAQGAFVLWVAPGATSVHASLEGYAKGRVLAVAPAASVELYLTPHSVLIGRVVLAHHEAEQSAQRGLEGIEVYVDETHATRTDAEGRFRLEGLAPGSYKPEALDGQHYGAAAELVHLGFGETSEEIEIPLHALALLTGTIVVAGTEPEPKPCVRGSLSIEHVELGSSRDAAIERGDGRVEIPGLLPGRYRVQIQCEGYLASEERAELLIEGSELVERNWEVREGLTIRGRVLDSKAQGLEQIEVSARRLAEGEHARARQVYARAQSVDGGAFVIAGLPPGIYELDAHDEGMRGIWTPSQVKLRVELEPGADAEGLELVMPSTSSLRGRVLDARGEPVAGIAVVARLEQGGTRYDSRTNEAGEFLLERVPAGRAKVSALDDGNTWEGTPLRRPGTRDNDPQGESVELLAGETLELELIVEARGGVLRGRVVDTEGAPVSDAFVHAERMNERAGVSAAVERSKARRWSWSDQPVLTEPDGSFELEGLAASGKFIVVAHRKGGGEASAEGVELGSELELVLAQTGTLGGTVVHADGSVPDEIEISLNDRSTGFTRRERFFRCGGRWRMTNMPAGRFVIYARGGGAMVETEAELAQGQRREDLALELQPLLTVTGTIVDIDTREPIAGLSVYARNTSMHDEESVTGSDGRFTIDKVPHGDVRVIIDPRGSDQRERYNPIWHIEQLKPEPLVQDVGEIGLIANRLGPDDPEGELGLTVQRGGGELPLEQYRITLAAVEPGGPAERAGLVAGDQILSVDGHDVTAALAPRWLLLTRVPPGTSLSLGLAGGRTLTLVAG